MTPRLTVVIPTRDRAALLARTLDALDVQNGSGRPFEVIVADDGTSDETPPELAHLGPRSFPLRSIRSRGRGPATARNAAIALAAADRILLLGDDTLPRSDTLARHLNLAGGRAIGVQGHVDWHPDEEITAVMRYLAPAGPQFYFAGLVSGRAIPYTAVLGSNLSAPVHWFREEPFDEGFRAAAFEDTELAYRWARHGWETVYSADAVCWHSHPYREIEPFLARQRLAGEAARYAVSKHPALVFRTVLAPLAVGAVKAALARLRGSGRIEDEWDARTRLAFLRGCFGRRRRRP
jgi:glycosyltransferase involved in cell wall biosynthesis